MPPQESPNASAAASNTFTAREVVEILRPQGWLVDDATPAQVAWCERAAALLGPHVNERRSLADLLHPVFHYNAQELLAKVEAHAVLSRYAARDLSLIHI